MKASFRNKLEGLAERHTEIAQLLASPDAAEDPDQLRRLSQEYSQLEPVAAAWKAWQENQAALEEARAMLTEDDPELRAMAEAEIASLSEQTEALEAELYRHLIPRDPHDDANVFLEIRAGTGGDEAALFAGDLLRMYTRYAENQGWKLEILNASEGEHGGYREVVARLAGQGAYSRLKFESGAHRVQRVPETESQGRIHTSACTVAILPEVDSVDEIHVDPNDLRVDTYRASGAGGQHVNKTDSAVRLTHLPSGIVVECQDERSQHKNRAKALALLQAKLLSSAQEEQTAEQSASRRLQVGSGDRSERIRTYNFPQNRLTDHRINLTLYKLDEVMMGNLDQVVEPLRREHQADLLAELTTD